MPHFNFFSHERYSERLMILNEGYSMVHRFTIGCVLGDEKNLLIDAGLGMTQDLRRYVETVIGSETPIACVCTNGYLDHVGSALQFEERYCSALDTGNAALSAHMFCTDDRYEALVDYALESKLVMNYCKEQMIPNNQTEFLDIRDGDVLELGGASLQVIGMPGVTPGSIALYNPDERYVFTGDAVNTDVHLERMNRFELLAYADTLRRFLSIVGDDVTIYPYHLPLSMNADVAKHLIQACEEVAAGQITRDPPGETIFHLHQNNRNLRAHWCHGSCVVYDRSRLEV